MSSFQQHRIGEKIAEILAGFADLTGQGSSWTTLGLVAEALAERYPELPPVLGRAGRNPGGRSLASYLRDGLQAHPHPNVELAEVFTGWADAQWMVRYRYTTQYPARLTRDQRRMLEEYEGLCGLEPLYLEDFANGEISFPDLWAKNVDHLHGIYASVSNISTAGVDTGAGIAKAWRRR